MESNFLKNVFKLSLGNLGRYTVSFLAAPILSRLYSPEDFGVYGVFVSVATILSIWATLGYEAAIVPAESDEEASIIMSLSFSALFFNAMLMAIFVLVLTSVRPGIVFKYSLWLAPLAVIGYSSTKILTFWNNRYERYAVISVSRTIVPVISSITQVALHFVKSLGLIIGTVGGNIGASVFLLRKPQFKFDPQLLTKTARKYYRYPTYYLWSSLIYMLSQQIPIILLERFFNPWVSGIYTFVNRIILVPIGLIGMSFGQVFFREILEKKADEVRDLTLKSIKILLKVSIPSVLVLLFAGEPVFSTIFGHKWQYAGRVAAIFSIWTLILFVTSPLTFLFLVKKKQKDLFWFNLVFLASRILPIVFGSAGGNFELVFVLLSAGSVLVRFAVLWRTASLLSLRFQEVLSVLIEESLIPLGIFVVSRIALTFLMSTNNLIVPTAVYIIAAGFSYLYNFRELIIALKNRI